MNRDRATFYGLVSFLVLSAMWTLMRLQLPLALYVCMCVCVCSTFHATTDSCFVHHTHIALRSSINFIRGNVWTIPKNAKQTNIYIYIQYICQQRKHGRNLYYIDQEFILHCLNVIEIESDGRYRYVDKYLLQMPATLMLMNIVRLLICCELKQPCNNCEYAKRKRLANMHTITTYR